MECEQCGHRVDESDRFCSGCGAPQPSRELPPPVVETAQAPAVHAAPTAEIGEPTSSLRVAISAGPEGSPELDVRFDEQLWVQPNDDEAVLGRWICPVLKAYAPAGPHGPSGLREAVDGSGTLVLTTRRIVGTLRGGTSSAGPSSPASGNVVVFSLPLVDVRDLRVNRERGEFGDNETGLMIGSRGGDLVVGDFDRFLAENGHSQISGQSEAARAILGAVGDALRPVTDEAALERILSGDWDEEDGALVARIPPALNRPTADEPDLDPEPVSAVLGLGNHPTVADPAWSRHEEAAAEVSYAIPPPPLPLADLPPPSPELPDASADDERTMVAHPRGPEAIPPPPPPLPSFAPDPEGDDVDDRDVTRIVMPPPPPVWATDDHGHESGLDDDRAATHVLPPPPPPPIDLGPPTLEVGPGGAATEASTDPGGLDRAVAVLRERLAGGEISIDEYRELLAVLRDSDL